MAKHPFTIFIVWITIVFFACSPKDSDFQSLLQAQGDYQSFLAVDSICYNLFYTAYSPAYEIVDTLFRKIRTKRNHVQGSFSCQPDSFFTSPTYALFPFSFGLKYPITDFTKRDTFENQVYHVYSLDHSCKAGQPIQHTLYCSYLNDQIRFHLIKLDDNYFRIDVITWQKEGGILFPLRNKIYVSDSLATRIFLRADLIYSNIEFK
jgi:hypothetical protein